MADRRADRVVDVTGPSQRPVIAGYVIALNEEAVIARCLESLSGAVDHVYVLDSRSTDSTREIARSLGATVEERDFDDYSSQRNHALDRVNELFTPDFVLAIDADEHLQAPSAEVIRDACAIGQADVHVVRLGVVFEGRRLRHGLRGDLRLPRLFRSALRYETRGVNEHLDIPADARVEEIDAEILDEDATTWTELIDKHNKYSSVEAAVRAARLREKSSWSRPPRQRHMRNRWIRTHLYERLPFHVVLAFIYQYVIKRGFLDGRAGLDRAVLDSIMEFMIDRKTAELTSDD